MAKAKIIGTGLYVPGEPISNEQVQELTGIELDCAKLKNKLGIETRHIAKLSGVEESSLDFATQATMRALEDAGVDPQEVGLFIVGSDTPEYISPSTANMLQGRIQGGPRKAGAFDINSSCASFSIGYDTASRILATDPSIKYAVVTGVYNMPAFVKDGDAFGYSIFADGAGSVVLERTSDEDASGYINGHLYTDGTQWDYIGIYTGGTKQPLSQEVLDSEDYGLHLIKPLPGDRNIKLWPVIVDQLVEKVGCQVADIDHIIFTQINRYVIEKVMEILNFPMEKTTTIMGQYGYTGSGCIPMAFHHAVKDGVVKRGDRVAFVASGSGLAVGSNIFTY